MQRGNWSDNNTWSSATAPAVDYVGTLGDTIFIDHIVQVSDFGNKMDITGPVVIVIGDNGDLTDSSASLGYSTGYPDVQFKTSFDAKPCRYF